MQRTLLKSAAADDDDENRNERNDRDESSGQRMIRSQKDLADIQQPGVEVLTQSEKLLLRYEDARVWVSENLRTVVIGIAAVALLIVGLFVWSAQRQQNADRAATYLSRVLPLTFQGDYRRAIDGDMKQKVQGDPIYGLRYIVKEYGSTPAGSQAAIALGNIYYMIGQYDSAKIAYDDASSDYPVLRSAIEAGRAAIAEHNGNRVEAAKLLESAAKRDKVNPMNGYYLLQAARDYGAAPDKRDEAVRVYKEVLEQYPQSQFDDNAKRELMKLNVEL